jgi:hypothetical protein
VPSAPGTGGLSGGCAAPRGDADAGSVVSRADVLFRMLGLARRKAAYRSNGLSLSGQTAPVRGPGLRGRERERRAIGVPELPNPAVSSHPDVSGVGVGTVEDGPARFPGT